MMAVICGYCCPTQAPFYRLTDQSGRSTEIGRIVEVALEEVRQHMHVCKKCQHQLVRVQELQKQLKRLCTKLKGMVQASSPRAISHSSQHVDYSLHNASVAAMPICRCHH